MSSLRDYSECKKLLELFDVETQKGNCKSSDRALWHLLKYWENRLPELDDYFHKAFRQIDVTDYGYVDMAIWNLLNDSTLFWRLFERVQGEKKEKNKEKV